MALSAAASAAAALRESNIAWRSNQNRQRQPAGERSASWRAAGEAHGGLKSGRKNSGVRRLHQRRQRLDLRRIGNISGGAKNGGCVAKRVRWRRQWAHGAGGCFQRNAAYRRAVARNAARKPASVTHIMGGGMRRFRFAPARSMAAARRLAAARRGCGHILRKA